MKTPMMLCLAMKVQMIRCKNDRRFFSKVILSALALVLLAGMALVCPQAQTVYVDGCRPPGDGSQANPFNTLTLAVARAAAGSTLVVQRGSYPERPTIQKNLTITASGGPVLVGQPARTQKICQLTGEFDRERQQPPSIARKQIII